MSKEINNKTKQGFIQRIMMLQPASKALWGNMSVDEMMFHCTKVANEILSARPSGNKPTLKQQVTKAFGLYLMKNFPKGIKSGDKYVKKEEDIINFNTERENIITIINKIAGYEDAIYGRHPFFGPLKTKEWKRFLFKHLDHHLRQFSV